MACWRRHFRHACVCVCVEFKLCPHQIHPSCASSPTLHCSDDDDRTLTVFSDCYWLQCESHSSQRKGDKVRNTSANEQIGFTQPASLMHQHSDLTNVFFYFFFVKNVQYICSKVASILYPSLCKRDSIHILMHILGIKWQICI